MSDRMFTTLQTSKKCSDFLVNPCSFLIINQQEVADGNLSFAIPQLYISTNKFQGQYYEQIYKATLENRFKGKQDEIEEYRKSRAEMINQKISYMESRGNVTIEKVSGPHCLYQYAPDEMAEIIANFI